MKYIVWKSSTGRLDISPKPAELDDQDKICYEVKGQFESWQEAFDFLRKEKEKVND